SRPEARRGATKRQEPKRPAGRRPATPRTSAPAEDRDVDAAGDPPPAHPARSRPQDLRDGEVLVLPEADPPADEPHDNDDDHPQPDVAAAGQTRRASSPANGRKQ